MAKKEKGTMFKNSDYEPIFGLAKINDEVNITLGASVISSKKFKTFEDAEKYIASKPYELLLNAAVVLMKFTNENENEKTTN